MSIADLLTRTVTIVRRSDSGNTDDYGNAIPAETTTDTVGELQQQQRNEPGDQGETSDTRWALFLPAGTEIGTSDTVTVDGQAFEMVGDPWTVRDPETGSDSHLECTVRRTG